MQSAWDERRVWRLDAQRVRSGDQSADHDCIAVEEPIEIRVAGRSIGITMRTPGHDEELALGFLVGEGVIRAACDVERVRVCGRDDGSLVDVLVASEVVVDFARLTRHVFASSSCGVCGTTTIASIRRRIAPMQSSASMAAATLAALVSAIEPMQSIFEVTGGVHAAALFRTDGTLLAVREDIGRHNAVDKIVGYALRAGLLPLQDHALLVSGRASFEIVQKALAAGIPIVAAVSAASSLAVDLADESGITLIGFLRPGRATIYTHPRRVIVR